MSIIICEHLPLVSLSPQVLAWHDKYNKRMKERVKDEGYPVKNPTDILSDMVSCNYTNIYCF